MTFKYRHEGTIQKLSNVTRVISTSVGQGANSIPLGWKDSPKVGRQRKDYLNPRKEKPASEKSNRTLLFLKEDRKILES